MEDGPRGIKGEVVGDEHNRAVQGSYDDAIGQAEAPRWAGTRPKGVDISGEVFGIYAGDIGGSGNCGPAAAYENVVKDHSGVRVGRNGCVTLQELGVPKAKVFGSRRSADGLIGIAEPQVAQGWGNVLGARQVKERTAVGGGLGLAAAEPNAGTDGVIFCGGKEHGRKRVLRLTDQLAHDCQA